MGGWGRLASCWLIIGGWWMVAAASAQEANLPTPRELPSIEQEPDGSLSLDQAIELLLQRNYDLRLKFQDIPKARADVLSAGLRNNPSMFFSSDGIPYSNYSPQRPGETDYELTLIQPTDVSGKRRRRIQLAQRAERVIEALYQDAVRQEIDKLYTAYLDVLGATIRVRTDQADLALQNEWVKMARGLVRPGLQPRADLTQALVNQHRAENALRSSEAGLLQMRRDLAVLLAAPVEQADTLAVRDPIRDSSPPQPSVDDLIGLALRIRPDLMAYRLNVDRAGASAADAGRKNRRCAVFLHALSDHGLPFAAVPGGAGLGGRGAGRSAGLRP